MKTVVIIGAIGTAVLCGGCSVTHEELPPQGDPIGFATSVVRASVSELGEGDSFAVWAREHTSSMVRQIFTREEVRCTGGLWSYDNLRYWQLASVYDFHALYPHDVANVELQQTGDGSSVLVVTGFDARGAVDLMAAERTNLSYAGSPSPVTFTFRHLLTRVEFVGRIDPALAESGVSARIVSASLYGMPATGSVTIEPGSDGVWSFDGNTSADAPFCSGGAQTPVGRRGEPFRRAAAVRTAGGNGWTLTLEYEYTDANYSQNRFTKSIRLADAGVTEWAPGTGYRYSFTVGRDYILFNEPEVVPWRTASGGIITVEVTPLMQKKR